MNKRVRTDLLLAVFITIVFLVIQLQLHLAEKRMKSLEFIEYHRIISEHTHRYWDGKIRRNE